MCSRSHLYKLLIKTYARKPCTVENQALGKTTHCWKYLEKISAIKNSTKKEEPLQESNEMIKIYKRNRAKGSKPVKKQQNSLGSRVFEHFWVGADKSQSEMLQRRSSTASCTERNVDPVNVFSYDPIFQFQINSIGYVNTPMYILYIILTDFFFIVSEKPSKLTMGVCVVIVVST